VFTITVPAEQEPAARQLVLGLSPNARLTYSVGGTLKFELPTSEVRSPLRLQEWHLRRLQLMLGCALSCVGNKPASVAEAAPVRHLSFCATASAHLAEL